MSSHTVKCTTHVVVLLGYYGDYDVISISAAVVVKGFLCRIRIVSSSLWIVEWKFSAMQGDVVLQLCVIFRWRYGRWPLY